MNKMELERENKRLRSLVSLENHEKKYLHIPKLSILPIVGSVVSGLLLWVWYYVLVACWEVLGISTLFEESPVFLGAYQFGFVSVILFAYVIVCSFILSVVALSKGGYKHLKPFDEGGLVVGLVVGLVFGLVFGLVVGLVAGLVVGLVFGLVFGLVVGLIVGLVVGLVVGLALGLSEEYT